MASISYNHYDESKSFSNLKFIEDDTLLVYNRISTKKFAKKEVYKYAKCNK